MALSVLLATPACSAEAGRADSSDGPARVEIALPAKPASAVLDQAEVLPAAEEAALDDRLRRLWAETGDALVVVTIKSLEGQAIEDYAFTLFNDWGIGDANTHRGLLILVAPNERRVRIEVGCGLEATVSNQLASDIIEQKMTPAFREGDFPGGTKAGAEALMAQMALPKPANDPGPSSELCRTQAKEAA